MSFFLSIETSSEICSVALSNDNHIIEEAFEVESNAHASKLTLLIEHILNNSKIQTKDLTGIFLSEGPGSYTGLRIGTATAKGICYSLNIPLIAINSLDALILQAANSTADFLCPMIDARRMEVYCKLVQRNDNREILSTSAVILEPNSFENHLQNRTIVFFGSGSDKFKAIVKSNNAMFIDSIKPKANAIALLGFKYWQAKKFQNLREFEPNYLKDFQAKKSIKPLFPPATK